MKRYLITFAVFCAALLTPLFAAKVTDNAHLLGVNEVPRLESDLSSLPVWIETYNTLPNDNIKSYADNRIRELANDSKGFIIVVTTHPRAWRISMNPQGFVGGEATRQIGDTMAGHFKRGEFYYAFNEAARNLTSLTTPSHPANSIPVAPVATSEQPRELTKHDLDKDSSWAWWLFGLLGFGVIVTIIVLIQRTDKRAREEQARRAEIEATTRRLDREKREKREKELREKQTNAALEAKTKKEQIGASEAKKASKAWESYPTSSSRYSAVYPYMSSPHYHSGVLSDPIMFWLFMNAVAPSHTTYTPPPTSSPSNESSSRSSSSSPSSSSSDDSYYRNSSSSDSWGSSGGWDSGSSGGFSSSDSGGSSGSW